MPLIENADPAAVVTELQPEFPSLITSFLRLSPHSKAVGEKILADRQLRFELDLSTHEFLFKGAAFHDGIAPFHQRFCVGLKAIERTWAAVFGYQVLFQWTADRFNANLSKQPLPPAPAALSAAIESLNWAFAKEHDDGLVPWPSTIPSPARPFPDPALMKVVNSTAVRTVGWILLHELGHFDRGHFDTKPGETPAVSDHEAEFEADDWAAETATNPIDLDHCKSNLCVGPFALGVVAGITRKESDDHPSAAQRLLRYYKQYIVPKTFGDGSFFNTALFATTTPLQALLFMKGIHPGDLKIFADLDDFLPWWESEMDRLSGS